ncbi:SigE family RNA polymerase sigma factor [Actinoplanes sp. GCM10030250]|uniref:SigE family RNA polymerase sigma factor n=1 Tax=Actinoplanes sp. GCM10030250 TaxID=3273376 RepID=UPI0036104EFB
MLELLDPPDIRVRTGRSGIRMRLTAPPGPAQREQFARFAQSWTPRLYSSAFQLCRDWHLAQDLTQTTLTKLFVNWSRAASSDNLPAYAQKVLLRVYLDHRRRRSSSEAVPGRLREPAYTMSPELRLTMLDALDQLPARDRAIVLLRYFADLSVEQVAAELGVPVTVVKSQTRRSLMKLREMLRGDRAALFA